MRQVGLLPRNILSLRFVSRGHTEGRGGMTKFFLHFHKFICKCALKYKFMIKILIDLGQYGNIYWVRVMGTA